MISVPVVLIIRQQYNNYLNNFESFHICQQRHSKIFSSIETIETLPQQNNPIRSITLNILPCKFVFHAVHQSPQGNLFPFLPRLAALLTDVTDDSRRDGVSQPAARPRCPTHGNRRDATRRC